MIKLVFSYSHKDEELRDQLEIHLALLKRQKVIDTWHDRRIIAGDEIDSKINLHFEEANIILLLVSPDFIASNYCYDTEMKNAMKRHEAGEARVIPVILRPCDWHYAPFGKLLATPTDGKAVTKYPNQDEAFLDITRAVRKAADTFPKLASAQQSNSQSLETIQPKQLDSSSHLATPTSLRSSNLRIKKEFTERDKDEFRDKAFDYIAKYFEGSLAELEKRNPELQTTFRKVDANTFTSRIYVSGKKQSSCTVRLGGLVGGISYSSSDAAHDTSFNESLSVNHNESTLHLKAMMGGLYGRPNEHLSFEGAAEYLWNMLITPLQ